MQLISATVFTSAVLLVSSLVAAAPLAERDPDGPNPVPTPAPDPNAAYNYKITPYQGRDCTGEPAASTWSGLRSRLDFNIWGLDTKTPLSVLFYDIDHAPWLFNAYSGLDSARSELIAASQSADGTLTDPSPWAASWVSAHPPIQQDQIAYHTAVGGALPPNSQCVSAPEGQVLLFAQYGR